jgi:putative nucleotidyltransferase with HDIG domain
MSATGSKRRKKEKPATTIKPALKRVPMSDVIAALSHALDLTEGASKGHSVRTCMIGMRTGQAAGLTDESLAELYYALLLKDAGCSSNASRIASLFGSDDHYLKPRLKSVDWDDRRRLAMETWHVIARGGTVWSRVRHFLGVAQQPMVTRELIASRCERGGSIARRLGFPEATALAIQSLDEHWNGKGHPQGLAGEAIPQLSRIMNLAQTIEVFLAKGDRTAADAVLVERRGRWFDPALTDVAREQLRDETWCENLRSPEIDTHVSQLEPGRAREVDAKGLDQIAEAFADIVDAKSPFTHRHSTMVAAYAKAIGQQLGFKRDDLRQLYRAGLLHDIGKLGISSRILDKPGALDNRERGEMKEHPRFTWEILRRVNAFEGFALVAALHHEKLDGSGYPWGRMEEDLDVPARVLAVADIYEAVTETRAYRVGLSSGEAMQILRAHAGFRLDTDAIDALEAAVATEPAVSLEESTAL